MVVLGDLTYRFIDFISIISRTLIPLSFTIYFFVYKEQKDVAISLFKKRTNFFNIYNSFLFTTFLTFLVGILFEPDVKEKLSTTNIIMAFVYVTWILISIGAYRHLLNSINIIKTFDNSLKSIEASLYKVEQYKLLKKHRHVNSTLISKKITYEVKEISIHAEILFQILLSKKKYNLINDFSSSLQQLESRLFLNLTDIINDQEKFSEILPLSTGEFGKLILIVQKGLLELLDVALELNNPRDIKILTRSFIHIRPFIFEINRDMQAMWNNGINSKESLEDCFKVIYDEYYLATYRVVDKLYRRNNSEAFSILKGLIRYDRESEVFAKNNDLLTLFASLITNAIERNDLKQLTDVSNILFGYLIHILPSDNGRESDNILDINKAHIRRRITETSQPIETEKKVQKLFILAIVKAIELGRYSCAGFLIKNTVNNFRQKIFVEEIYNLNNNIDIIEPDLELSKKLSDLLPLNFSFSTASYGYCFKKATLLLYYQQRYSSLRKINYFKPNEFINLHIIFIQKNYLFYLNDKIAGLAKEYGLIMLNESEFSSIKITSNRFRLEERKFTRSNRFH